MLMIERDFDVPFVADLALREKQIQQNYRPVVAVHKWFARRPGTLFRGLLLSEFLDAPLRQTFYRGQSLPDLRILDPFMGGGTTLIEANRVGCAVTGFDINPMAWWIVRQEIGELNLEEYLQAARVLRGALLNDVSRFYKTQCETCGSEDAHVKYFLWVKSLTCQGCGTLVDLFPNYLLAEDARHPANVFVCRACGQLYESKSRKDPGDCPHCRTAFSIEFTARRNRSKCEHCGALNAYPRPASGPPTHRMFAIEYHCEHCRNSHSGRFFKNPSADDLRQYNEAQACFDALRSTFIPEEEIPAGDETDRLHRWGYRFYREMFNARQLLGLELSCRLIRQHRSPQIAEALATNLSDLIRYQNMLCRYDTMALKSLDVFSVHGFPVGLIQCESNLLGVAGRTATVGSGGWLNITEKFARAKAYCQHPFEVRHLGHRKVQVPIDGEWIGDRRHRAGQTQTKQVRLERADATVVSLEGMKFDAIFTDPPYFRNVQYAELMDFCYVWLRRLALADHPEFAPLTTRHANELTGNDNMGRTLEHFTEGMSRVFQKMASALKPGSPLAFTYHHNRLDAYYPVAVAMLDSGLVCSASLPCPAEMGASIHINGTSSSIIDTVFVCRSTGKVPRRWLSANPAALAQVVREDLRLLAGGGVKATQGDTRCIAFGHLIRLAVWNLRKGWKLTRPARSRKEAVSKWIEDFGGVEAVLRELGADFTSAQATQQWLASEEPQPYRTRVHEVSF
ncbi:MAG TPA: DNA methylase [Verrucomicrobiota bacterium]|nr:MAG: DNA methylase [Verrucomicrobia bacterium ADurb.Bin006]HOA59982.1 DNA methylase [Verrucomicrobiota bacterium]HOF47543.1 DNA methylase [Verrucomicrobiota bacterium]HOG86054.1 DNA methylase [Verrucomicrobiota bacterium]HOR70508.1 DNA methylase [Verrucomicrobiota bacterium]